jgi:hypothetical protein
LRINTTVSFGFAFSRPSSRLSDNRCRPFREMPVDGQ